MKEEKEKVKFYWNKVIAEKKEVNQLKNLRIWNNFILRKDSVTIENKIKNEIISANYDYSSNKKTNDSFNSNETFNSKTSDITNRIRYQKQRLHFLEKLKEKLLTNK